MRLRLADDLGMVTSQNLPMKSCIVRGRERLMRPYEIMNAVDHDQWYFSWRTMPVTAVISLTDANEDFSHG